jgi:hypothetical protein
VPVVVKDAPEAIAWSIGGRPVALQWDSCTMRAPGGYDRLTGTVTWQKGSGRLTRSRLHQGAQVVGTRSNRKVLYQGTIVSPPKIIDNVATIEAEGYAAIVRRRTQRLPYIIADATQWSAEDEQPFDYAQNERYTLQSKNDALGIIINKNENYNNGDECGYAIYIPGHAVQRVKATMRKKGPDNANFDLRLRGTDELGALSVVSTNGLGGGNPDGTVFNMAVAGDKNTVTIGINCNSAGSPGATTRITLQDVTVCAIADNVAWTCSQVVSDVAQRLGFADDVEASATEIESLDWTGSWDELLTYMAAVEDFTWLVLENNTKGPKADAQLTFRPWGNKVWRTTLDLCDESLTVAPLYNRVTVSFERPAGVPQHKSFEPEDFGLDDPIPGLTYEYPDPPVLENPQRSRNVVNAIGERMLRRVVVPRLVGNVKVMGLLQGRPFDIKAGDKLAIQDYVPKVGPQRIASVTYNRDGTVDCGLERSFDVAAMLFRLTAHRRRTSPHSWGSGHRS